MDQAEREVMQDGERGAENMCTAIEMILSTLEWSIESLNEEIKKVNEGISELRSAGARKFLSSEEIQKIQDRINELEIKIRWMDKDQEKYEKDLQNCKPWEFSKKNQLKKEIERLERYKTSSREDIEPLQQKLKEKDKEYWKEHSKERDLEEKKKNLEQKLKEKEKEYSFEYSKYSKAGYMNKVNEIRRRRNMENWPFPSHDFNKPTLENLGKGVGDMAEIMQKVVTRGRGRIRR